MSEQPAVWPRVRVVLRSLVTPVVLLVLLGGLIGAAWWGYKAVFAPFVGPPPTPCVTKAATALSSAEVATRVLNGGFTSGLAGKVGAALESKGFQVVRITNTEERVKKTVVVGRTVDAPEVKLVAGFFTEPELRADGRIDGTVDVLVGSEHQGMNMEAPVQIEVPGGEVCLRPSGSPSPSVPTPPASPAG